MSKRFLCSVTKPGQQIRGHVSYHEACVKAKQGREGTGPIRWMKKNIDHFAPQGYVSIRCYGYFSLLSRTNLYGCCPLAREAS
jgi:hypothetical protein